MVRTYYVPTVLKVYMNIFQFETMMVPMISNVLPIIKKRNEKTKKVFKFVSSNLYCFGTFSSKFKPILFTLGSNLMNLSRATSTT